jgi:GxxExxY protein
MGGFTGGVGYYRMTIRRPGGLAHEHITEEIIGAFYQVYNTLGYGFLESVYKAPLVLELKRRGLEVACEVSILVYYKDVEIAWQRADLVVEQAVIVEVKSTRRLARTAVRQLYNYLSATRLEVGLLLHFGPKARFYRLYSPNRQQHAEPAPELFAPGSQPNPRAVSDEPDHSA